MVAIVTVWIYIGTILFFFSSYIYLKDGGRELTVVVMYEKIKNNLKNQEKLIF